jgi:PE-PPE domain
VAKHRQSTANKWTPYVTTGIALNAATLFAFTYATDSHVTLNPLLSATTSIFVDGTKSITGNEEGISPYRMADSFTGKYDQTPGVDTADSVNNKFVVYPRSLGLLTGIGDPTYDKSEGEATAKTVQAVRDAIADPSYQQGDTIYVVGYSQGAGAVVEAIPELETDPYFDGANIQYVLGANPRRNDGGILARLPAGVYVPILGVTFGGGTDTEDTDAHVLQVTKQYDGVADAPNYVFNVVADLNAVMGFYYLHSGYYKDIDPTPDESASDRIVTHSADGRITDVLIKAPVGELPLTMPLLQLGVPKEVVKALDPFLRAIIETGYDRPAVVPAQPVPFQLLPPPSKWLPDVQSVATGAVKTGQALTGTTTPPHSDPALNQKNVNVTTVVEQDPESGQDVVEGQDPPPSDTPDPDAIVVDKSKAPTTPTQGKPETPAKKFEPPRKPFGGWKPGDLLRKIFHPKPKTDGGASDVKQTTAPEPSGPPAPPATTPSDGEQNPEPAQDAA